MYLGDSGTIYKEKQNKTKQNNTGPMIWMMPLPSVAYIPI